MSQEVSEMLAKCLKLRSENVVWNFGNLLFVVCSIGDLFLFVVFCNLQTYCPGLLCKIEVVSFVVRDIVAARSR